MPLTAWPTTTDDGGDFTSGTAANAALFDAIRASIENDVISPAYPTTKAADIIDEVAAARGNKLSLSERLNVLTDADGNFLSGVVQRLLTDRTQYQSVNAALTNLAMYSMPANTLRVNGQAIRVTATGILGANVNTKIIRFVFGASNMIFGSSGLSGAHWRVSVDIIRDSNITQFANGMCSINGQSADNVLNASPAPTETLSGVIILGFKGQGVVTGDVTQYTMMVELLN